MRKQTKVLAAAALFTLGASFSAFAAKKGTWVLEDEGWMCLDKDGDPYTNEWCLSGGKEFYMGDDGIMVTSDWVEYDNNHYYVGSDGTKTINDWRYVTPHTDEDADEEWFFFDGKGKKVKNKKKVINGKTYYFDNDGIMLTGWVDTVEFVEEDTDILNVVYCGEDGARLAKEWIEVYAPEVDEEEDDLDNKDMNWYWINNDGTPATGKKSNIKGETYYFNNDGHMLSGWVAREISGYKTDGTTPIYKYFEIGYKDVTDTIDEFDAVFFCGSSDDGHAKKNTWIKTWRNTEYYEKDTDDTKYWFWIEKDGEVYVPTASDAAFTTAAEVKLEEGALNDTSEDMTFSTTTLSKKVYAFNKYGEMISGLVRTYDASGKDAGVMYFGGEDDGVQKTGSLSINDNCDEAYKFYFGTKTVDGYTKYVGVTGNKGGKLYNDGLLVTSETYKYDDVTLTIDGTSYNFIVNSNGTVQTSKKLYEDGDFSKDLREYTKANGKKQVVTFTNVKGKDTVKNSYTVTEK